MNTKICPKCGNSNSAQMSFCSNCGQNLPAAAPNFAEDPPPTVFMGQAPPPQSQSQNPPPPQSPFGQPAQPTAPNFAPSPTSAPPPQPPKKSNKGLIFGVVGCLGLLLFSGIGLAILGFVFYSAADPTVSDNPSPTPNASNSFIANKTAANTATNTASNTASTEDESGSSTLLLAILEARKEVGAFNQTDAKAVPAADYFPEGNGAAQAVYSNGSKSVYLTVGMFDSMDDAKKNFNDQLKGIKSGGGKVSYENTASDGTISAAYENRGYYFAEYCNTNNFCNRIHSDSREALKTFFESYAGS